MTDEEKFMSIIYDEHLETRSSVILLCHNMRIGEGMLETLAYMYPPSNGRRGQLQYGKNRILIRTLDNIEQSRGFRGVVIIDPDIYILNKSSGIARDRLERVEEFAAHTTRQEIIRRHKEKYG